MVEIKNTHVYDLKESVVASGNAMRIEPEEVTEETFDKGLERAKKLAKLGGGTGHSNFRTGIRVSFDLKYPQYFTKQIQRYHFLDYVSSTSMMHKILKMDFSKCCNKYVSLSTIEHITELIEWYNVLEKEKEQTNAEGIISDYKTQIYWYIPAEPYKSFEYPDTIEECLYDCYMRIISNCPMGAELWVHCSTNYEQLATIYRQRKHHKLKEDWGEFCKWIESLPYAQELIICK